jgi:hypothetical protein
MTLPGDLISEPEVLPITQILLPRVVIQTLTGRLY